MPASEPPSSPSRMHTVAIFSRRHLHRRGSSLPPINRDDEERVMDEDETVGGKKGTDDDNKKDGLGDREGKKSSTPVPWEQKNPKSLEAITEEGSSYTSTVGKQEQLSSTTSPYIAPPPPVDHSSFKPGPESSRHNPSVNDLTKTPIHDDAATAPTAPNLFDPLPTYDWTAFTARYEAQLERLHQQEVGLMEEFEAWVSMFHIWATTGQETEEERGRKRLRTQVAFVQIKEREVEEKRQHYIKVVQAFESALALLG